jgi:hypothetical protein
MAPAAVPARRCCGEGCERAAGVFVDDCPGLSIERVAVVEDEEDPKAQRLRGIDELVEAGAGEVVDTHFLFHRGPVEIVPNEAHTCFGKP